MKLFTSGYHNTLTSTKKPVILISIILFLIALSLPAVPADESGNAKGKSVKERIAEQREKLRKKQENAREPEVKQPEVKQPDVKQPAAKQPEAKQPEVKQPEVKQPQTETTQPEAQQPDVKPPAAKQPQTETTQPEVKTLTSDKQAKPEKKSDSEKKAGIVLSFDDGYPSWFSVIAPKIASVGGVATGFVNNFRFHNASISINDLLTLQNKYHWEIGVHTYHHHNAPKYVRTYGMQDWLKNEYYAAIDELTQKGLNVKNMVFPFNDYTPELKSEALKKLKATRDPDVFPLDSCSLSGKGTFPGGAIDMSQYVPLNILLKMVDVTVERGKCLFLYGHEVLPDELFIEGTVVSVTADTIVSDIKIRKIPEDHAYCLIPDKRTRYSGPSLKVIASTDNSMQISRSGLQDLTAPGAPFVLGPCYGMKMSDFNTFIDYVAARLRFYTVHDVVH